MVTFKAWSHRLLFAHIILGFFPSNCTCFFVSWVAPWAATAKDPLCKYPTGCSKAWSTKPIKSLTRPISICRSLCGSMTKSFPEVRLGVALIQTKSETMRCASLITWWKDVRKVLGFKTLSLGRIWVWVPLWMHGKSALCFPFVFYACWNREYIIIGNLHSRTSSKTVPGSIV